VRLLLAESGRKIEKVEFLYMKAAGKKRQRQEN
jgi:hypothetical protein